MIFTNRLVIRPVSSEDVDRLFSWYNQPDVMNGYGYQYGLMKPTEYFKELVTTELHNHDLISQQARFMICEKQSGHPIGELHYHHYDSFNQSCEIEIKIAVHEKRRMGIGYEAYHAFISFLFNHLNLTKITATMFKTNQQALKLHQKLNFTVEGILRLQEVNRSTGLKEDLILMGLLKSEFFS